MITSLTENVESHRGRDGVLLLFHQQPPPTSSRFRHYITLEIMHTYDEHGDDVQGIGKLPEAATGRLRLTAD